MNRIIGSCMLFLLFLTSSCGTQQFFHSIADNKQIDSRLVGVWQGSETDQQILGMTKEWKMTRKQNGTFTLDFKITQNNQVYTTIEEGTWWVKDGLFYEFHKVSGLTDVYDYSILSNKQVKFIAKNLNMNEANQEYKFIDTKVSD